MLAGLRRHITYANAMASIAVVLALGGTSYAVSKIDSGDIANNSVRSEDLRNNDVRGKDIRKGAVSTSDVKNASLLTEDFKAGQLPAGPPGAPGQPGPQGEPGPQGSQGEQGVAGPGASRMDLKLTVLPYSFDLTSTSVTGTVLTLHELTVTLECSRVGTAMGSELSFSSTVPAKVTVWGALAKDNTFESMQSRQGDVGPGTPLNDLFGAGAQSPDRRRADGEFVYRNATRVITAAFHLGVSADGNNPSANFCEFWGTAVPAA